MGIWIWMFLIWGNSILPLSTPAPAMPEPAITPGQFPTFLLEKGQLLPRKGRLEVVSFQNGKALKLSGITQSGPHTSYLIGSVKLPRPVLLKGKQCQMRITVQAPPKTVMALAIRFFQSPRPEKPVWSFLNWDQLPESAEFPVKMSMDAGINLDFQPDRVAGDAEEWCDRIEFHVGSRTAGVPVSVYFSDFRLVDAPPPVYPSGWTPQPRYATSPATVQHPAGYVKTPGIERARKNIHTEWGQAILKEIRNKAAFWIGLSQENIALMIPREDAWSKCLCPHCGALPEFAWGKDEVLLEDLRRIRCARCGTIFPNERYPENHVYTVEAPHGGKKNIVCHLGKDQIAQQENFGPRYHITGAINAVKLRRLPAIESVAMLYVLEGKREYAEKVRSVLLRFAEVYPGYNCKFRATAYSSPRRHFMAGKISGWKFQDSCVILPVLNAYTLTVNSGVYSDADRLAIENGICREYKHLITAWPPRDQCTNAIPAHLAAAAMCAALTGDHELMKWVLSGPNGLPAFLRRYYTRDGHWHELSASYGNMASTPLLPLALILNQYSDAPEYQKADRYDHLNIFDAVPELETVFKAMALGTLPTGNFPAFNDSNAFSRQLPGQLELVHALRPTPENRQLLNYFLKHYPSPWGQEYSLWLRPPEILSTESVERPQSMNQGLLHSGAGWAILRHRHNAETNAVALFAGPYAGGHSHNSTLSYLYCHAGREVISDLGYLSWWHNLREWNNSALAHNIVLIDRAPQKNSRLGIAELFAGQGEIQAMRFDAASAWPGIARRYARSLYSIPLPSKSQYLIDIFDVEGGKEHLWCFHADGATWKLPETLSFRPAAIGEFASKAAGADFLKEVSAADLPPGTHITEWHYDRELTTRVHWINRHPMTLIRAVGSGLRDQKTPDAEVPLHLQLIRAQGPSNRFVAVVECYSGTPEVLKVEPVPIPNGDLILRITTQSGEDLFQMSADGRSSALLRRERGVPILAWAEGGAAIHGVRSPAPVKTRITAVQAERREITLDWPFPEPLPDTVGQLLVVPERKDGAYLLGTARQQGKTATIGLAGQAAINLKPGDHCILHFYREKRF